jgi:hypothetical protein
MPLTDAAALSAGLVIPAPVKVATSAEPGAMPPAQHAPELKSVPELFHVMEAAWIGNAEAKRTSPLRRRKRYLGFILSSRVQGLGRLANPPGWMAGDRDTKMRKKSGHSPSRFFTRQHPDRRVRVSCGYFAPDWIKASASRSKVRAMIQSHQNP